MAENIIAGAPDFSYLDRFTPEDIANFKQSARIRLTEPQHAERFLLERTPVGVQRHVIAEGDSWFDYPPGVDLIDCLTNLFGYHIEGYAKHGDTLENMIYGTGITRSFQREVPQIYTILRRIKELQPKVFLFSGGGNDVAGDEFASYLNHKLSGLPAFRVNFATEVINNVFRRYFVSLIDQVAQRSPNTHIVTHGYGHTLPTGKGVEIVGFTFAGPWLRPALTQKAILDETEQQTIAFRVIDIYNEMLADLAAAHPNFHYVDLRPILDPHTDWANELHLTRSAYGKAAYELHKVMAPLFP